MNKQLTRISKLLSLVLRHQPDHIGLTLDNEGWAKVPELIEKINQQGMHLDFATLQLIVDSNDKKRFAFNDDQTCIRASQGHSIDIELNLVAQTPPELLYHGTAGKSIDAIKSDGLRKMSRQHVHLTTSLTTAQQVGQRYGRPVILTVQALLMHEQHYEFYLSDNGVWLTDHVPVQFIQF